MRFASLTPLTLLDYPGELAAMVFTAGCNLRCSYCHNPELVDPLCMRKVEDEFWEEEEVLGFLSTRKGLLSGLVLCGGEPTLHGDLEAFLRKVKEMGFLIKLDTNGASPFVLERLLDQSLLSYVALDVKTLPEYYPKLTGQDVGKKVCASLQLLKRSTIPFEVRTTIFPRTHTPHMLHKMGLLLRGIPLWALQQGKVGNTLEKHFQREATYSSSSMHALSRELEGYVEHMLVRGG